MIRSKETLIKLINEMELSKAKFEVLLDHPDVKNDEVYVNCIKDSIQNIDNIIVNAKLDLAITEKVGSTVKSVDGAITRFINDLVGMKKWKLET